MKIKNIFKENAIPIILTLVILLVGSVFYFTSDTSKTGMFSGTTKENKNIKLDPVIYDEMNLKVNFTPEGMMKIFANTNSEYLANLKTDEGKSIPGKYSMVIGYDEAMLMKDENLFQKTGDVLNDFFGINTTVNGILKKTGTPIDNFHFLNEKQYSKIEGNEEVLFILLENNTTPELFYKFNQKENDENIFKLKEGNISDFKVYKMLNNEYYPIILGSTEAKDMREEKMFTNIGDVINDLQGKHFIVIGVLEETGTIIDDLHLINLKADDFL